MDDIGKEAFLKIMRIAQDLPGMSTQPDREVACRQILVLLLQGLLNGTPDGLAPKSKETTNAPAAGQPT